MKTAKQIKETIDLHQTCIELLEHIRSYNNRAMLFIEEASYYSNRQYPDAEKTMIHHSEICEMVSARLTERYNKILKAL